MAWTEGGGQDKADQLRGVSKPRVHILWAERRRIGDLFGRWASCTGEHGELPVGAAVVQAIKTTTRFPVVASVRVSTSVTTEDLREAGQAAARWESPGDLARNVECALLISDALGAPSGSAEPPTSPPCLPGGPVVCVYWWAVPSPLGG